MTEPSAHFRQREISDAVRERRRERRVAAPIVEKLNRWHEQGARLGAIANHRLLHRQSIEDLPAEIEAVRREVIDELETWRMARGDGEVTGYVYDAERSCRSILSTLDELARRLSHSRN